MSWTPRWDDFDIVKDQGLNHKTTMMPQISLTCEMSVKYHHMIGFRAHFQHVHPSMALVRAAQGTSADSNTCGGYRYDVFLSFRGEDTRKTFTDHLYTALNNAGFLTFRDDDELERGEDIKPGLQKAIQLSRTYVVVFSKDYASSRWCLDELVLILEHKRTSTDHVVLPVFYDVDPSHLRKQREKTQSPKKVKGWRDALAEAADLAGMVLADGYESKFIEKIVKVIEDKLSRTSLSVEPKLIGIHSRVKGINLWLQDGSIDVGILVVYGMSGMGKTTIAKHVYNSNFRSFEGSSFIENINEKANQPNGLVQMQLLYDLLNSREVKIHGVDEGLSKIERVISSRRVLLVLDDVDHMDQLDAVLKMKDWFYPGKKVVRYYDGLPLALKVLGSSLSGESIDVWESALEKLKVIPNDEIMNKLIISYDSLQDHHDRKLFLHIACFLIGRNKSYIVRILDGCDFYTIVGMQNLIDRCMVTIDGCNNVQMHDMIRDMGREIARHESKDPEKRSRLWYHKDSFEVLKEKNPLPSLKILDVSHSHALTEIMDFSLCPSLEELILVDCTSLIDVHESIGNMDRLMYLNVKDCKNLRMLPKNMCLLKSLETLILSGCSNLDEFPVEMMKKMESLKVLETDGIPIRLELEVQGQHIDNMVEWEYMFKLESIDRVDGEMIKLLGLCNLGSMPAIRMYCPITGQFSDKSIKSFISYSVPLLPSSHRIQGLNIFATYANKEDADKNDYPLIIKVSNKSKGLKWIYCPLFYGIPGDGEDMIWLSHWKMENETILQSGDQVVVSVMARKRSDSSPQAIHEFVILLDTDIFGFPPCFQDVFCLQNIEVQMCSTSSNTA
ncbi:unnamed protein product [Malus baccata var. baccata]